MLGKRRHGEDELKIRVHLGHFVRHVPNRLAAKHPRGRKLDVLQEAACIRRQQAVQITEGHIGGSRADVVVADVWVIILDNDLVKIFPPSGAGPRTADGPTLRNPFGCFLGSPSLGELHPAGSGEGMMPITSL